MTSFASVVAIVDITHKVEYLFKNLNQFAPNLRLMFGVGTQTERSGGLYKSRVDQLLRNAQTELHRK